MSKKCEMCGKKASVGNSVSHSNRKTKRKWRPNLQKIRASVQGAVRRMNVCAGCIKSGRITKP